MTDIIIISYKDEEDLKRCTASIREHCRDYNLIIEDNNISNVGFTRAVNAGIRKGKGEWIWLLNSDAIVKDGMTQQALLDRFSYSRKVGIVGSMQIDFDDHDLIRHGGTVQAFPNGIHKGGKISAGDCRFPEKQTWVNFASVMFSRDMYNRIGPLDESMYLLYSDSSYCFSARAAGYECWYEPQSRVYHRLNASKTVTEWHQKDLINFMRKWGIRPSDDGRTFYLSREFDRLNRLP
jgi:hypothetical protein